MKKMLNFHRFLSDFSLPDNGPDFSPFSFGIHRQGAPGRTWTVWTRHGRAGFVHVRFCPMISE
jgi:hypothetical protein